LLGSGARPIGTARTRRTTGPCGCGSGRSRTPGFGTDIVGFRSCLGARAGASITSGHTGSTARRGSTCVGSVLVGTLRAADGWPGQLERLNACWSMDFVVDSLFNGHRFRALIVVDIYSRECLAIEAGQSMTGAEVAAVIERLVRERGAPDRIQFDNWREFISRVLDKWAYEHGVMLDFSRPGKPSDNAMIESFNGTFRDECLNVNWFLLMEDAREKTENCRMDYNEFRPHSSLGDLTPRQFVDKYKSSIRSQKTPFLAGSVFG
jgi:transposase InsO family protein